jgi:hypothetical protein
VPVVVVVDVVVEVVEVAAVVVDVDCRPPPTPMVLVVIVVALLATLVDIVIAVDVVVVALAVNTKKKKKKKKNKMKHALRTIKRNESISNFDCCSFALRESVARALRPTTQTRQQSHSCSPEPTTTTTTNQVKYPSFPFSRCYQHLKCRWIDCLSQTQRARRRQMRNQCRRSGECRRGRGSGRGG